MCLQLRSSPQQTPSPGEGSTSGRCPLQLVIVPVVEQHDLLLLAVLVLVLVLLLVPVLDRLEYLKHGAIGEQQPSENRRLQAAVFT